MRLIVYSEYNDDAIVLVTLRGSGSRGEEVFTVMIIGSLIISTNNI